MNRDVIINKCAVIERCVKRVVEEYGGSAASLENLTKQDSVMLNLLRACEAVIDLAMHLVAEQSLGVPQSSRDSIEMLRKHGIIYPSTAQSMKNMIGFRNIALHDYHALNLLIVQAIIERHLIDFRHYVEEILGATLRK